MLSLREAIKIVKENIPEHQILRKSYAEAQGRYLFVAENSQGMIQYPLIYNRFSAERN